MYRIHGEEIRLGYRALALSGPQPASALVEDCHSYLSIDQNVSKPVLNLDTTCRTEPEWTGPNYLLWDSYQDLTQWLLGVSTQPSKENWEILEIGLWSDLTSSLLLECLREAQGVNFIGPHLGSADDIAGRGSLLGYDVADQGQISAIHNVWFRHFELDRIRASFKADWNNYGLFDDPAAASQLAAVASILCPEHAPFFVYYMKRM